MIKSANNLSKQGDSVELCQGRTQVQAWGATNLPQTAQNFQKFPLIFFQNLMYILLLPPSPKFYKISLQFFKTLYILHFVPPSPRKKLLILPIFDSLLRRNKVNGHSKESS